MPGNSLTICCSSALVALLLANAAQGQLTVLQSSLDALELFETIFGTVSGIAVTNPQLIGSPLSIGLFDGGETVIGIPSGVVFSNGQVIDVNGPNTATTSSTSLNTPGDPSLPTPNNDASGLLVEFEVITPVEFVISYVFTSEEYDESINSFPDPFGIFIDGENIALSPDGLPISPQSINCPFDANCDLFVPNFSGDIDIGFDGLTLVLNATTMVLEPGPHVLKIVVADITDTVVDTAALLTGQAILFAEEPAVTVSDPHVQGFNGQHFDFDGELGREYAFISTPNLEMNVRVQEAYASGVNIHQPADRSSGGHGVAGGSASSAVVMEPFHQKGTWVTDVGMLLRFGDGTTRTIEIKAKTQSVLQAVQVSHSKTAPQGTILLDHVRISRVGTYSLGEGSMLTVKKSKSYTRVSILSKAHSFNATIDIVSPPSTWTENMMLGDSSYFKLWHLNFAVHELGYSNIDLVHGVVGQTVNSLSAGLQGEESDYLLEDGLLGHQFTYDKFDQPATAMTTGARPSHDINGARSASVTRAKSVFVLPEITPGEFEQLRDLELSYTAITAMDQGQFITLFHLQTQSEYDVFNQYTLGEAVMDLNANVTTKHDIISNTRQELGVVFNANPKLMQSNPAGVRDIIQRLAVALYKPKE